MEKMIESNLMQRYLVDGTSISQRQALRMANLLTNPEATDKDLKMELATIFRKYSTITDVLDS